MPLPLRASARALYNELLALRNEIETEGDSRFETWLPRIERIDFKPSAHNLACYIALRHRDLRPLQEQLVPFGLSSLGRLESRVLGNLDAVLRALLALSGTPPDDDAAFDPERFRRGAEQLSAATDLLFGAPPAGRRGRLMVTMPSDAAFDVEFLNACACAGMDVARINCAHDDPDRWDAMIRTIRQLRRPDGQPVTVLMDIAGPKSRIEAVAARPHADRVFAGDRILLVRDALRPVELWPTQVLTGIPEALDALRIGAEVWFDDGKLGCIIERFEADDAVLRVTHARTKGARLRVEKGVNFPGTEVTVPALTEQDRQVLGFIAGHADMVGYSFVQTADDIIALQEELARHRPDDWRSLGIIAKIETQRGVHNLPDIIVAAAGRQPLGVMIARGDLAVELGFERMAEMQEEILWMCEAAQIPVIWATQVLEEFVRKGMPSRGEMTDAAMAGRAECIMLNKGPNTVQALELLQRLMVRMSAHQFKKTARLRALHSW